MSKNQLLNALKPEHALHWYQIERVLGHGAFGITYLAHDINLDRPVAIKEYMPSQLCMRAEDLSIQPLSDKHAEDFQWGLSRFISEARTLTKFEHPNLVRVFNVFEMNNTAYMVMNYEVGESLQMILKRKKALSEQELSRILIPLMSGLELIHDKGFIHRDIKPGNVFIRKDGSPVLLDFGSARQTRGREEPQTLTNFVSPGYAPIEQYTSKSDRQGPWTDIYGMGATLYKAMTGVSPTTAIDRSEMIMNGIEDDYKALHQLVKDRYSDKFIAAIDHALAFNAQDRPKTIAEWRAEFDFDEGEVLTMPAVVIEENGGGTGQAEPVRKSANGSVSEATTVNVTSGDTLSTLVMTTRLGQLISDNKFLVAGIVITATALVAVIMLLLHGPGYEKLLQDAGMGVRKPAAETAAKEDTKAATPAADTGTNPLVAAADENPGAMDKPDTVAPAAAKPAPSAVGAVQMVTAAANNAAKTPAAANTAKAPTDSEAAVTPAAVNTTKASANNDIANAKADEDQQHIDKLLRQAKADIKDLRLMTPKGNNAYERYREVLSLDKDNKAATAGIQSLSDRYLKLSYGAMKDGRIRLARVYLWRAEQLTPGSPAVVRARNRLRALSTTRQATSASPQTTKQQVEQPAEQEQQAGESEEDSGFVDNVMKWFKESSEKPQAPPTESTTSQGVRKALGGH